MLLQSSAAVSSSANQHNEGTSSHIATFDGRSNYCADEAAAVSNFTTHNKPLNVPFNSSVVGPANAVPPAALSSSHNQLVSYKKMQASQH